MSMAQILAALPRLTADERTEVRARLDELADAAHPPAAHHPAASHAAHPPVSHGAADQRTRDTTLDTYDVSPDGGSTWDAVKAAAPAK